jgi:AbrB family looped-hinge helix DNA binding protein
MKTVVSITSQGQVTIPITIRKSLQIKGATKAVVEKQGNKIIIEPKKSFWSLAGSLSSGIVLSDNQLKKARKDFSKQWKLFFSPLG